MTEQIVASRGDSPRLVGKGWGNQAKYLVCYFLVWFGLVNNAAAEVLQSISDTSVNVVIEPQAADKERHFDYRVICAPGDEILDDCQSRGMSSSDAIEGKPTMVLPLPAFPPEATEPEPHSPKKAEKRHVAPSAKSGKAEKTKSKRAEKAKTAAKSKSAGKHGKSQGRMR